MGAAEPLTGLDGALALRLYLRVANAGVRFNAERLERALRSKAGRAHVLATLRRVTASRRPAGVSRPQTLRTSRLTRRVRRSRQRRLRAVGTPAGRPAGPVPGPGLA